MSDSMDKFNQAANFTFHPSVEGEYTVDNGGPTNFGITQTALDNFNNKNGYPSMKVEDMTPDDAKLVAQKQYFEEPKLDMLPDRIAVAAFDYSINSGPHQAIKDLQRVVGVDTDGKMGPETQRAVDLYVQQNGEDALLHNYTERRTNLMSNLIMNNPTKYGPNLNGWSNRIKNLKDYLNFSQATPTEEIA